MKIFPLLIAAPLLACSLPLANAALTTGAERLAAEDFAPIQGTRVGLITNHTATVGDRHLADVLHASEAVELTALFGPEHGIRGDLPAGARIDDAVDEETGVAVYSLYGEIRKPTPEMLENVDVLMFDIQDVGARFYTYISTMGYGMQAAAEKRIPFVVLDRPNPLGGERVEGFMLEPGLESFVGLYPIPIAHGMTVAELALMIQGEKMLPGLDKLELRVVPMEGWKRDLLWSDLDREWNPPSPNIPDFPTALIYPGSCFFEGTTASEGRGTREPFMVVGAPWIDAQKLADDLNGRDLPGLRFEPVKFTPVSIQHMATKPKFRDQEIQGVRHVITDQAEVMPVAAGVHLLEAFLNQAPDKEAFFREGTIQRLSGTRRLHKELLEGKPAAEIAQSWADGVREFKELRGQYLLYQ